MGLHVIGRDRQPGGHLTTCTEPPPRANHYTKHQGNRWKDRNILDLIEHICSSMEVRQKNKQVTTWNSDIKYAEINTGQCTRGKLGARKAGCRLASSSVSSAVLAWGTPASPTCTVEGGGGGSLHHPRGLLQVTFPTIHFWENTYSAKGHGLNGRDVLSPLWRVVNFAGEEAEVGRAPSAQ